VKSKKWGDILSIKEKMPKLEKEVMQIVNTIVENFLKKFYHENQRIRNAVFNLLEQSNGRFVDPFLGEEINSFELKSIFGKWKEMDKMYEEIQEMISDDLMKLDIDKEKLFPIKYTEIWELGDNLRKCLEEDGILDVVIKKQQANEIRAMHWMASVRFINSIFISKPLIWDKDKKTCHIPWPILIDSYIRDFELYMKYVIRPYLYEKDEKHKSYNEDLEKFFASNNEFHGIIRKNIMKPWLRSRLAHHQYCINNEEKKVIFFKHDEDDKESTKELLIDDLLKLSINMNFFLWVTLFILYEKEYEIDDNESKFFNANRKEKLFSKYLFIKDIENICDQIRKNHHLNPKLKLLFNNYNIQNKFPFVFRESRTFYLVHFERQDANMNYFYWVLSKIAFLVAHSVMMDRFIKPIAVSLKKKLTYRSKEKDLLKVVMKYHEGEYKDIFNWVDIELRNNLAHYTYEIDENNRHYYLNNKEERIYFTISPISKLHLIFDRLEVAFNTKYEEDLYDYGIVKIILLLIYRDEDLKTIEFYKEAIDVISNEDKFRFLFAMCNFVIYFLHIEKEELNQANEILKEIAEFFAKLTDVEIEFLWAWIINIIKKYPQSNFTKIYRGIHYFNNKQIRKARQFLEN